MPQQETFLHEAANAVTVDVLKTYDPNYAREVFRAMDDDAMLVLATALDIEQTYSKEDIPRIGTAEFEDLLWEELYGSAQEDVRLDPNLRSFFVVRESRNGKSDDLYVAGDWPSAEKFARERLARSEGART
jgi:hypothetical protein